MYGRFKDHMEAQLRQIRERGLYKKERVLETPQGVEIRTESGAKVLNFCANNYLGFCNEPRVMAAANYAFFRWGFGLASVRFICGTQKVHRELESRLAEFLGMDDAILYSSAFDANGGVFEPLLDETCAIVSDELNHASIIDGVRLAKAKRFVYRNNDMDDLEDQLVQAREANFKLIATDGVFSMDGTIAQVDKICDLADRYEALVLVDDSHATGFIGPTGRGTHEHCGVMDRVDLIVTTFGKALGGASGGCVAGRREIVEFLRQRSRPYLFSNSLSPAITGATVEVLKILGESAELRERLMSNTRLFRDGMEQSRVPHRPGHPSHRAGTLRPSPGRRPPEPGFRHRPARRGHLCHRLQLSGRARRQVAHPRPDQRRPYARPDRLRPGQVPPRRPEARGDLSRS